MNTPGNILVVQRALPHYRCAVFEELARRFGGRLVLAAPRTFPSTLTPLEMAPDLPLVELKVQRIVVLGQEFFRLPKLESLLQEVRPIAVVIEGNPRIITTWNLPRLCARYGARAVGWTKFASPGVGLVQRRLWTSYARRWPALIMYGETSKHTALQWGVPERHVFVAQNAVDIPESPAALAELKAAAIQKRRALGLAHIPVIVSLGRQVPGKRFGDVIRAFAKVRQRGLNGVLCVVGTGPEESRLRSLSHALCDRTQLDRSGVQFVGLVPEGEDAVWLALADVAVFGGAVGLAVNVSLAVETPTIVADEQGSDTEILIDGVTGLRFQKGDIASLSNVLQTLLEQPALGAQLARRGRELVLERATLRRMVDGMEAGIRYALAAGNEPSRFAGSREEERQR